MPFTVCCVLKDLNIVGNDTKLNNDTMQDYTCRIMDFFCHRAGPSQAIDRFKINVMLFWRRVVTKISLALG
jgi:hypothetical protein